MREGASEAAGVQNRKKEGRKKPSSSKASYLPGGMESSTDDDELWERAAARNEVLSDSSLEPGEVREHFTTYGDSYIEIGESAAMKEKRRRQKAASERRVNALLRASNRESRRTDRRGRADSSSSDSGDEGKRERGSAPSPQVVATASPAAADGEERESKEDSLSAAAAQAAATEEQERESQGGTLSSAAAATAEGEEKKGQDGSSSFSSARGTTGGEGRAGQDGTAPTGARREDIATRAEGESTKGASSAAADKEGEPVQETALTAVGNSDQGKAVAQESRYFFDWDDHIVSEEEKQAKRRSSVCLQACDDADQSELETSSGVQSTAGEWTTLMPTAYLKLEGPGNAYLWCLLDSGASRSFLANRNRELVYVRDSHKSLLVQGLNGLSRANEKAHCTLRSTAGDCSHVIQVDFYLAESLGVLAECDLTPEQLGEDAGALADTWPRPQREIDAILGQDVLWDLYRGSPKHIPGLGSLVVYPSKLGKVVAGLYDPDSLNPRAAQHALQVLLAEPAFHLLHPQLNSPKNKVLRTDRECVMAFVGIEKEGAEKEVEDLLCKAHEETTTRKTESASERRTRELAELSNKLDSFMKYESLGIEPPPEGAAAQLTPLEQAAMDSVDSSLTYEDGKYSVGLTFHPDKPELLDNQYQALLRFKNLERQFKRVEGLKEKYVGAINEFIANGDVEEVHDEGLQGATFYLPHRAVINLDKSTSKTRVVFDGSAKASNGVSLNDCLLKGPAGNQDLMKILIGFRWEQTAFSGDVKRMFLCIGMEPKDRDHLRFFWRENEEDELRTFRFTAVTFGLTDAPFLAQEVFKRHAAKYKDKYPLAVDILINRRWVDDLLGSLRSPKVAAEVIEQIKEIMAEGGFPVKKWVCSSQQVMDTIPEEDRLDLGQPIRFQGAEGVDSADDNIDEQKTSALGVTWLIIRDVFKISGSNPAPLEAGRMVTKRFMASKVASIFDPLGFVAPFTITGKRLLQLTWEHEKKLYKSQGLTGNKLMIAKKKGWDAELPAAIVEKFRDWYAEISILKQFETHRSLVLKDKTIKRRQLHVFGDASPFGCATAAFVRVEYMNGEVTCRLLASKSKVAPSEDSGDTGKTNLPRLELTSAVMSKRLADKVLAEKPATPVAYWADSSVALQWIRTGHMDKKIWVANRVREIRSVSPAESWRHVPSEDNPSDLATRGVPVEEFLDSQLWVQGPKWLRSPPESWPDRKFKMQDLNLKEFSKEVAEPGTVEQAEALAMLMAQAPQQKATRLEEYAPWSPLKRIRERLQHLHEILEVTVLFMFKSQGQGKPTMTPERRRAALVAHIKDEQRLYFGSEITLLERNLPVHKNSPLFRAGPVLDAEGLLRARGRLPFDGREAPPAIVARKSSFTAKLIQDVHRKVSHRGAGWTTYHFLKEYWCSQASFLIKGEILRCLLCKRAKKAMLQQGMAPLPPWRMDPRPRPFTYVGVDYAGPLYAYKATGKGKGKKKDQVVMEKSHKLWFIIFTCMQMRAVHLEIVDSMDTDTLNRAVRRFMARRGKPSVFYSDNGRSFVKFASELKALFDTMNIGAVRSNLQQEGVEWRFNADRGSWWGGLFERLIKTTKETLRIVLHGKYTEDEVLTHVVETEAIVNSRPLAHVTNAAGEDLPITPSMLLLGYDVVAGPLPHVPSQGRWEGPKKLWARREHLAQLAFRKFAKDYISNLHQQKKWFEYAKDLLHEGDLVLVEGGSNKRREWPLGRVLQCYPGRDGFVRAVDVKTQHGVLKRPIQKVIHLEAQGDDEPMGDMGAHPGDDLDDDRGAVSPVAQ